MTEPMHAQGDLEHYMEACSRLTAEREQLKAELERERTARNEQIEARLQQDEWQREQTLDLLRLCEGYLFEIGTEGAESLRRDVLAVLAGRNQPKEA